MSDKKNLEKVLKGVGKLADFAANAVLLTVPYTTTIIGYNFGQEHCGALAAWVTGYGGYVVGMLAAGSLKFWHVYPNIPEAPSSHDKPPGPNGPK